MKLFKQLEEMQQRMRQVQSDLAEETVQVQSADGAVKIVISGTQRVQQVQVSAELLALQDVDLLNDVLVLVFNQAIEHSQALAAERLSGATTGLNLPGV